MEHYEACANLCKYPCVQNVLRKRALVNVFFSHIRNGAEDGSKQSIDSLLSICASGECIFLMDHTKGKLEKTDPIYHIHTVSIKCFVGYLTVSLN